MISDVNLQTQQLEIIEIINYLPHRYPFLLIDRVVELNRGLSILALKNVTINEHFFQGHFPSLPVMPGVLIIEAMAQASGLLYSANVGVNLTKDICFLVGIDKARFKKPVVPGDQLLIHVSIARIMRNIAKFVATATVNNKIVSEAELMISKQKT